MGACCSHTAGDRYRLGVQVDIRDVAWLADCAKSRLRRGVVRKVRNPAGGRRLKVPDCDIPHAHNALIAVAQSWYAAHVHVHPASLGPHTQPSQHLLTQLDIDRAAVQLEDAFSAHADMAGGNTGEAGLHAVLNAQWALWWNHALGKADEYLCTPSKASAEALSKLWLLTAVSALAGSAHERCTYDSLVKFTQSDPEWLKPVLDKLVHPGAPQYRMYTSIDDFVYPLQQRPGAAASNTITILLTSDWGTGTPQAKWLLQQGAALNPDIVIHLGDVYYAGDVKEQEDNYYSISKEHTAGAWLYSVPGNHDYYCGGHGLLQVMDKLRKEGLTRQEASYFALESPKWLILAMDTGFNDSSPLATFSGSKLTFLQPSEVSWHRDKIIKAKAAGKKIILMSHHQYCSLTGLGGKAADKTMPSVNSELRAAFGDLLADITIWYWGHEHSLQLFAPYAGLERGRLIGNGAVPVLVTDKPYNVVSGLTRAAGESGLPQELANAGNGGKPVRMGTADFGVYHLNGYVALTLDLETGAGKADYYQVPWHSADVTAGSDWGTATCQYTETF